MLSSQTRTCFLTLCGALSGCSPRPFEPDEAVASRASALKIEDVRADASFHLTRPPIFAYAERAAVRLQDGRVLVAGGSAPDSVEGVAEAEVFDPVTEKWSEAPSMLKKHERALLFLLKDGRAVVLCGTGGAVDTPEVFDPKTSTWTLGQRLESSIWQSPTPAALLDDGRALIVSGQSSSLAYFFDTSALTWFPAPPLKHSRIHHSMTRLADGRVLVAGGVGGGPVPMSPLENRLISEIFDPATNSWSDAASLNAPHKGHLATLLDDGQVLLADVDTNSSEIFDPMAGPGGTWSPGPQMGGARLYSTLVSLKGGRALLAGGKGGEGVELESFVYSVGDKFWSPAGKLKNARASLSAARLEDGQVLLVGGNRIDVGGKPRAVTTAELFAPDEPAWRALDQQTDQFGTHTSTRLDDGRVLLAGFSSNFQDSLLVSFTPENVSFKPTAPMPTPHARGASVLLQDGRVMVAGGVSNMMQSAVAAVDFYDPKTEQWTSGPAMASPRARVFAARLDDGRVIVGSKHEDVMAKADVEVFDPALGSWAPFDVLPEDGTKWTNVVVMGKDRVLFSGFDGKGDALLEYVDLKSGDTSEFPLPDLYPSGNAELLRLPDGRVLVQSLANNTTTTKMGLFDPLEEAWSPLGIVPVSFGPANLLQEQVFWAEAGLTLPRSVFFRPEDEQFTLVNIPLRMSPLVGDQNRTTPLLDGRVLVTGATFQGYKAGAYLYGKSLGGGCSGPFECASGHCVDGYCCNEACDDDGSCNTCARIRGAEKNGVCTKTLTCAPYECDHIDVLHNGEEPVCKTACARASDCAAGYACTSAGLCEAAANVDIDEGCAIASGKTGRSEWWWLLAACVGLSRVRRRPRRALPCA